MDTIYKGLVAPRAQVAVGRPDIPQGERPGDLLVEMAKEAALTGFTRPDQVDVEPVAPSPVKAPDRVPERRGPELADDAELTG